MRVAVYVRISKDSTGEGAGVARQEEDCRAKALANGWTIVGVYSDNDVSAYSGARRPAYLALLDAIRAGTVDAVLCWHVDRLYRRTRELETYIEVCQPRNVPTYTVQSGPLDLATPSGRMIARTLGSVAQYESEQKAERQRRANLQRAQAGKHFMSHRSFGYEDNGITIREAEAQALRKAYSDVLRGVALAQIAREWNSQGLPTPHGNPWVGNAVGRTLRTSRVAGMRSYRGEIVTDSNGEPVETEWPAIIDRDTWFATVAFLSNRARPWPTPSRQFLSGVARCGVCGNKIESGGSRNGKRRYRCSGQNGHPCRESAPVDAYIEKVVMARLQEPDALALFDEPARDTGTSQRAEIAEIERKQTALAEAHMEGTITLAQLQAANVRAKEKIAALKAQLPAPSNPDLAKLTQSTNPVETWTQLDDDEKRNIIEALMEIRLHIAKNKDHAYLDWRNRIVNPATVEVIWKQPQA